MLKNNQKTTKLKSNENQEEIKKETNNNISYFYFLISNFYISNFINIDTLSDKEKYILSILSNFKIDGELKAREVQIALKDYLEDYGFDVGLEKHVDRNGIENHSGRIDLIANYKGKTIAIEYDNVSPRYKSIYKVENYNADLKVVMLRNSNEIRRENEVFLIGTSLMKTKNDMKYQLKEKLEEWLEYKKQRKDKPYTEIGFKKLLTQIENNVNKYGEEQVIELIDECMSNNYQGIIFDKLKLKKPIIKELPNWFDKKTKSEELTSDEEKVFDDLLEVL